jgi:hypothetical protein
MYVQPPPEGDFRGRKLFPTWCTAQVLLGRPTGAAFFNPRRPVMIKSGIVIVASTLSLIGCQDRPKIEAPVASQTINLPAGHPPIADGQTPSKGNPHAGIKAVKVPDTIPTSKATVLQSIDADIYTYIEAKNDNDKTIWMALPKINVQKGAKIEYPTNAFVVKNFTSKTLKKTFDSILFIQGINIIN